MSSSSSSQLSLTKTMTAAIFTVLGMGLGILASSFLTTQKKEDKKSTNASMSSIVLSLIQKRRSIFPKQYTGGQVSKEIIQELLEAARWAPNHNITEPWNFIVFESLESRTEMGTFLANYYKSKATPQKFSQAKYEKKLKNWQVSSHVVAIVCKKPQKNPLWEEICTMAMAVQNMHLLATTYKLGAYWSSPPSDGKNTDQLIQNPPALMEILNLDPDKFVCIGWFFIGEYYSETNEVSTKKWPKGRRTTMEEGRNVFWK